MLLGLVKVTDAATNNDEGGYAPCAQDSIVQYGLNDVHGGAHRPAVHAGDVIEFTESVQKRTQLRFAVNVRVVDSAVDRAVAAAIAAGTAPSRGVVESIDHKPVPHAVVALLDADEPVEVALAQVVGRADAAGNPVAGAGNDGGKVEDDTTGNVDNPEEAAAAAASASASTPSSKRRGTRLKVGDSVSVVVVQEPVYDGPDADDYLPPAAERPPRALVGGGVLVLPRGTVRISTVVGDALAGTVTTGLTWIPLAADPAAEAGAGGGAGGGGGRRGRPQQRGEGGVVTIALPAFEDFPAREVELPFTASQLASRQPAVKVGDGVACRVVYNYRRAELSLHAVRLVAPRAAARETGVVVFEKEQGMGTIRCVDRDHDVRFRSGDWVDAVDPAYSHAAGSDAGTAGFKAGTEVSFEPSLDRAGLVVATRLMRVPPGTARNFVELEAGVEGTVRAIVNPSGQRGQRGGRGRGRGRGGRNGRLGSSRDTLAVIAVTPSAESWTVMHPPYRVRPELLWALRDLAADIYRAEVAFGPACRLSAKDRKWLHALALAMGFQVTYQTAGGEEVDRPGVGFDGQMQVWKPAEFHDADGDNQGGNPGDAAAAAVADNGRRASGPVEREVRVPFSQFADPRSPPGVGDRVTLTLLWSARARQLRGTHVALAERETLVGVVDVFKAAEKFGFVRCPGREANIFFPTSEFAPGAQGEPDPVSLLRLGTALEFQLRRDHRGRDVATNLRIIPASRVKFPQVWRRGTVVPSSRKNTGGGRDGRKGGRGVNVEIQPEAKKAGSGRPPARVQVLGPSILPRAGGGRLTLIPGDVVEFTSERGRSQGRRPGPPRTVTTAVRLLQCAPERLRGLVVKAAASHGVLRPHVAAAAAEPAAAPAPAPAPDAADDKDNDGGDAPSGAGTDAVPAPTPRTTRGGRGTLSFRASEVAASLDAFVHPPRAAEDADGGAAAGGDATGAGAGAGAGAGSTTDAQAGGEASTDAVTGATAEEATDGGRTSQDARGTRSRSFPKRETMDLAEGDLVE